MRDGDGDGDGDSGGYGRTDWGEEYESFSSIGASEEY